MSSNRDQTENFTCSSRINGAKNTMVAFNVIKDMPCVFDNPLLLEILSGIHDSIQSFTNIKSFEILEAEEFSVNSLR